MTIHERLANFSPMLVRLLSHRTTEQIAAQMGVTTYAVSLISRQPEWSSINMRDAQAFMQACGVDLFAKSIKRHMDYLRHQPTFEYLRKSKEWSEHRALMVRWAEMCSPTNKTIAGLRDRILQCKAYAHGS